MLNVRRIVSLLILFFAAAASPGGPYVHASSQSLQELSSSERQAITEKFRALQKNVHSMHASVRQEKQLRALKKRVAIEGTIALAKPNMLRWEVREPERAITVIDGESMTVYHPDLKEAQVYALSEHLVARNAMTFFTTALGGAPGDMEKKFTVTMFRDEKGIVFKLVPVSRMVQKYLAQVVIHYDEQTGLPREFEITSPKGDRTVTRLITITINPDMNPETFKIKLPSDTWITNKFDYSGN